MSVHIWNVRPGPGSTATRHDPNEHSLAVVLPGLWLAAAAALASACRPSTQHLTDATPTPRSQHRAPSGVRPARRSVLSPRAGRQADGGPTAAALGTTGRFNGSDGPVDRLVLLVPLGGPLVPVGAIREATAAIRSTYGFRVQLDRKRPLPRWAFYRPRRRYRAEKLLSFLEALPAPRAFRVVGITTVDISTTKGRYPDWGILGLANMPGRAAVISIFRCRKRARNQAHVFHRFAKTVVHELGHTLGLEHCPTRGCIMHDAGGRVDSLDREYDLCPRCRARLTRLGYVLPPRSEPPWPKPPGWSWGP